MKTLLAQSVTFGIVGLINTAVGLSSIYMAMMSGLSPIAANIIGYMCGIVVSFILNRTLTFGIVQSEFQWKSLFVEIRRFMWAFLFAWTCNIAFVYACLKYTQISPYILQFFGVAIYSVVFFVLCRYWVYKSAH